MNIIHKGKNIDGKYVYELYADSNNTSFAEVFYDGTGKVSKVCCDVKFDTIIEFDSISGDWLEVVKRKENNCSDNR